MDLKKKIPYSKMKLQLKVNDKYTLTIEYVTHWTRWTLDSLRIWPRGLLVKWVEHKFRPKLKLLFIPFARASKKIYFRGTK